MRVLDLILVLYLLTFCVVSLEAATIYIPTDQPTIQAGINVAVHGDTVLVADGTYTGNGNRDIDYLGKAIVVMSENGPENCVIDCEGNGRGFNFHSGEESSSVLQGFTITNGIAGYGGGIYCESSSPIIKDNIITGNVASAYWGWGGGIACSYYSSATIIKNTITGNSSDYYGGGIGCMDSDLTITGNTITGNEGPWGGGSMSMYTSTATITNSILWGNSPDEFLVTSSTLSATYSNIQGGWEGEGNIDTDPLFVDPDNDDFSLQAGSPCIDAGNPSHEVPLGGGCRIDMGAYEYWKGFNCWKDKVPIQWQ